MELQILDWIQEMRTPFGDWVMPALSWLGNAGWIWIVLTVVLLSVPRTRRTGCILMAALLADVCLCNLLLKPLVARVRPYDVNTAVELLVHKPTDWSFPSGHTAASFASVTALYLAGEKRLWIAAFVLSVGIACSRLYLYVHYPTDVLGGILVGVAAGCLGTFCVRRVRKT